MKNLFLKWRGRGAVLLLAATAVAAQAAAPQVQTLGGGPNLASPAKSGSTDGDTFSYAKFRNPFSLAFDTNGNILIADQGNNKIRKVTKPGTGESLTSTFASGMRAPVGVAVDSSNYVYVVSQGDGKLRKFNGFGTLVETVSGFRSPTALALGSTGTVYVAELNGRLHKVLPGGGTELLNFTFNRPRGLAFVRGLLAVTESGSHRVKLVNLATDSVVATIGTTRGFFDGPADLAKFNQPYGIAAAPNGALVVADRSNHRLRVIDTNNTVTTLYGVSPSEWFRPFAGWVDGAGGDGGTAATRSPVGVLVSGEGVVYNTESYWDLLRQVTGTGLEFTGAGSGVSTNIIVEGTNTVVIVGTNVISLGFESGEASSDYVGAAGQTFFVPVTLTTAPGQPIYSFQMSLSVTGETGVVLDPFESRFESMVLRPFQTVTTNLFMNPPLITNVLGYIPITNNYEFLNSSLNLLGIGWFERKGETNLYPANAQDLITYSQAKNTSFPKSGNKTILGAYGFKIPTTALETDTFRVAVRNPSGSSDGISQPVPLRIPTDNGLGAGTLNTIKKVTLASRLYLVGDSTPFRWFNAGDFGDFQLVNTDLADLFQSIAEPIGYDLNRPPADSDLFDALDSSDGTLVPVPVDDGDTLDINNVFESDGVLNVDDLWVTFRRSLDPSLKWFARYWSNGQPQYVEVPNALAGGFGTATAPAKSKSLAKSASLVGPRPAARLTSGDASAWAGQTLEIPIQLSITTGYAARVALVSVSVVPLDGSPAITVPIQFSTTPALQNPEFVNSSGPNHYAAAWLNQNIPGVSGNSLFAILTLQVPASAGSRSAYRVVFDHFSASPDGMALFNASTSPGLILLSDRSASTWNDGIADAWRLRFFGSIYASDSAVSADPDGDGVINWTEYQNGTDPTDVNSH
jgi:hypothetical protein